MALTKEQKKKIIEDLKEKISRQKIMIFVDFKGLKVRDLFDLRRKLKKEDSQLSIAKKTLARIALEEYFPSLGQDLEKLGGQLAIVFGPHPPTTQKGVLPAKICYQFSQVNKNLKILGGFFENKFREAQEIITLAELPTKEELLAKFVWNIRAPIFNFINVLQGNLRGLVCILKQIEADRR